MNCRERFLTALERGQPDRVPTYDWIDDAVSAEVARYLGLDGAAGVTTFRKGEETAQSIDLYCRVVEALEVDATSNVHSIGLELHSGNFGRDKYGRGYRVSAHGMPHVVEAAVGTMSDLKGFDMASRLELSDFAGVRGVIERLGAERAHGLNMAGPFAESWDVMGGMDKMMVALGTDPELAHGVLCRIGEYQKAVLDIAAQIGIDFIMVDGDLCGNDHPLISHRHFTEFLYPCKRALVTHAHGLGLRIVKHSDGVVWPFMDDFVELGFDGFHPVQPQCMDMAQVKAHLAGRMCVFGNVDCLDLMVFGTPEAVEADVRRCIAQASPGGGHVLGSSNSLMPGIKPENVVALFRAAQRYGDYADIPAELMAAAARPDTTPSRERRRNRRRTNRAA